MRNPADHGAIEVRLHDLNQLFDTLDPSPFRERDLDRNAHEFVVESARELGSRPREIVLHFDEASNDRPLSDAQRVVSDAISTHFARQAQLSRRRMRQLMHRGLISLAIALAFLTILFVIVQVTGLARSESGVPTLVRESMIILAWVAMWRPLEIFLFDWWPIASDRRLYHRLSGIMVRIHHTDEDMK